MLWVTRGDPHIGNHVEPCRDSPITRGHVGTHPITWHLWAYVEPCRDSPIVRGQMATHPITWQNGPAPSSDTMWKFSGRRAEGPLQQHRYYPHLTTCTILRCGVLSQKASVIVRVG
ncbi:hypothetical protein ACE6H2_019488 [Prunus campanulata]